MLNILRSLRLLIIAALLGSSVTASAQPGLTSEGREFWFGFMPNFITPAQAISLYVATSAPNKIKVETYGDNGMIVSTQSITLGAGQAYKFKMSVGLSETRTRETPVYRAIRVTSSAPCTVVGYSDNSLTTDGFLAIPTPALGTEHYCFSYFDDAYSPGIDHLGGEFLIVAPYDSTRVTITTTANTTTTDDGKTIGHTKDQTWSINLKRGQTYLVQTTGWNYGVDDLTGSKVTSNKPIGFLSGHQRAEIELDDGKSKEHLIEMLPPTDQWGTEYVALPSPAKPVAGSYYRIISAEEGNRIKVNGSERMLNAGEFYEITQATAPMHFVSVNQRRFLVVQYGYEEGHFGDPGAGDATMIALTPVAQFVKHANFRTPSNSGSSFRHYLSIISTQEGISNLKVQKGQGTPTSLSAMGATPIPFQGTPFVGANILLTGEELTWSINSPAAFTFTQYGYTTVETYGYPGPRSFTSLEDIVPPKIDISLADSCGNRVLKISDKAGIADMKLIAQSEVAYYGATGFTDNYEFTIPPSFTPGDTVVLLTLSLIDHAKPGTVALYFIDEGGHDSIYYTSYTPKPVEWTIDAPLPAITRLGDTVCRVLTVRNLHTDSIIISPRGKHPEAPFRISPDGEYWLQPNDSLKFDLCFIPTDTLTYSDSIAVSTECYTTGFIVTSRAVRARIFAPDQYYGVVQPGNEICRDMELENRSEVPFVITGYLQSGDTSFHVVSPTFPVVLEPQAKTTVQICLTPNKDTGSFAARIDWLLDRPTMLDKTFTLLTAIVLKSGVTSEIESPVSIWPNPAADGVTIKLPADEQITRVVAIDVAGNSFPLGLSSNASEAHAETSTLPAGSYTMRVKTNRGQYILQLVIKR